MKRDFKYFNTDYLKNHTKINFVNIMDYNHKTREQYKKEQLDEYADVLAKKLEKDYYIETKFLYIEL